MKKSSQKSKLAEQVPVEADLMTCTDFSIELGSCRAEIEQFRKHMRQSVKIVLNELAGRSFRDLAERQMVTKQIREILDLAGLRIKCPHCGQPATIRCYDLRSGSKQGSFQFEHTGSRPTRHGGLSTFPSELALVEKPPARTRGRRPSQRESS